MKSLLIVAISCLALTTVVTANHHEGHEDEEKATSLVKKFVEHRRISHAEATFREVLARYQLEERVAHQLELDLVRSEFRILSAEKCGSGIEDAIKSREEVLGIEGHHARHHHKHHHHNETAESEEATATTEAPAQSAEQDIEPTTYWRRA